MCVHSVKCYVLFKAQCPLWTASLGGHLDVVKALLAGGANVNQVSKVCRHKHRMNTDHAFPNVCSLFSVYYFANSYSHYFTRTFTTYIHINKAHVCVLCGAGD